jgi:hypothetical protein
VATCGSSAAASLERASDVEGRRGALDCGCYCACAAPWPGRTWTSCDNPTLCALQSVSQNKVLSCWEIAIAGCAQHALSSELLLITPYRTHRMEMISTLVDMINAYARSHGRTTEDVAEPIHLISIAAN